jgi:hypothetical protein
MDVDKGFTGKLTNIKILQQIFKSISLNDEATFYLGSKGLKMTVEDSKTCQANAFISDDIFNEYKIERGEELNFSLSLSTVVECLNLFGISSATAGSTFSLGSSEQLANRPKALKI